MTSDHKEVNTIITWNDARVCIVVELNVAEGFQVAWDESGLVNVNCLDLSILTRGTVTSIVCNLFERMGKARLSCLL